MTNKITREDLTKIDCNSSGHPRYALHFLRLLNYDESYSSKLSIGNKYNIALDRAKKIGGKKYHNKSYGGGIAFVSFNSNDLINELNKLINGGVTMRKVKIIFNNNDSIITSMAKGLSDKAIKDYYAIGKVFNIGSGENDCMVKVQEVIILL